MSPLDDPDPPQKSWALYAYLCGDNKDLASHTRAQVEAIRARGASDQLHVAVQWDLPEGARRAIAPAAGSTWADEDLGRRNTGDPEELTTFLAWAIERCPATHVALVLSGTGLLDPRASIGRPDVDRSRIFTILDDTTERDALELASLRGALVKALGASSRQSIDLVAFDVSELQFLEVAYELDGLVDVLIAPQTPVPVDGWDFDRILQAITDALAANQTLSARDMGRLLVDTAGAAYTRRFDRTLSLSALDLSKLNDVANAFDTLSLAMLYSVGEELVWQSRERVFRGLRLPEAKLPSEKSARLVKKVEDQWLYDLVEMLSRFERELLESTKNGLATQLLTLLRRQDTVQLLASLRSIDRAGFQSGSRVRFAGLKTAIPDPQACRRELKLLIRALEDIVANGGRGDRSMIDARVADLLTKTGVPEGRGTWLEEWPAAAIEALAPPIANEYRVARREQQRARQLAQLTARVVRLLVPGDGSTGTGSLIFAHFTAPGADADDRTLAGVSLFRPSELDHLIASDYLQLNFNKRIHWTALLAVINLIGKHPRALWRIVSGVLATADHATRSELLSRIIGPDSVIGAFRQQFTVLAPLSALVLSLEPQAMAAAEEGDTPVALPDRLDAYRVRLERAGREALIEETISVVDRRTVDEVLDRLVALMRQTDPVSWHEADAVESLGRSLGEDILQGLGLALEKEAKGGSIGGVHLQLQIPRALMKYPWELMQHRGGWLSEHFALGRQVFTSGRVAPTRARLGGPIRALVIGNPKTRAARLDYGQKEAEDVAAIFERLRDETDGLLDFERNRDAHIGTELSGLQLRKLLRERRYDIIHFAGHASFDAKRPELSAWQLTDGPLSAQSIGTTLDWSDTEPWLVFANACEAGMEGDERRYQGDVFGLASAFLNQGVSAYIAPLWPIHDAVAAEMAGVFYNGLLKERQTAGESLRLARVAAKGRYYEPILSAGGDGSTAAAAGLALLSWAGIVLYGNSTTTIGQRLGAPTLADR